MKNLLMTVFQTGFLLKLILFVPLVCNAKIQEILLNYKPNVPWVIKEITYGNFAEFSKELAEYVDQLIINEYKTEKESFELRQKKWWQCMALESFLIFLSYDAQRNKFEILDFDVHSAQDKIAHEKLGFLPVIKLLQSVEVKSGHHMMFKFFAFYIDCLMQLFSYYLNQATLNIDNIQVRAQNIKMVRYINNLLKQKIKVLEMFKKTPVDKIKFDNSYSLLEKQNEELIELLESSDF